MNKEQKIKLIINSYELGKKHSRALTEFIISNDITEPQDTFWFMGAVKAHDEGKILAWFNSSSKPIPRVFQCAETFNRFPDRIDYCFAWRYLTTPPNN